MAPLTMKIPSEFRKHEAQLARISVDGPWCHRAFAYSRKFAFLCFRIRNQRSVHGFYVFT